MFWAVQVAQQRPLLGAVADPHPPPQCHCRKEIRHVFLCNLVIHHDHHRAAAIAEVKPRVGFLKASQGVEIQAAEFRQRQDASDKRPDHQHD